MFNTHIYLYTYMFILTHTLEMVKQEMARVKIDILGISKLKWTGMGEFNSNDH